MSGSCRYETQETCYAARHEAVRGMRADVLLSGMAVSVLPTAKRAIPAGYMPRVPTVLYRLSGHHMDPGGAAAMAHR